MGKTRVIAETAQASTASPRRRRRRSWVWNAISIGKEDTERQTLNVYRMELLGATVHPVTSGTMTLKDAVNETLREWTARVGDTHYVLGSVMGRTRFPTIVRDFQSVIGRESKRRFWTWREAPRRMPRVRRRRQQRNRPVL
jgi:tryptophan synthase beta chain